MSKLIAIEVVLVKFRIPLGIPNCIACEPVLLPINISVFGRLRIENFLKKKTVSEFFPRRFE